ncbi:MAG: hypothetical protein HWE13_01270 [Gammaproteobacteria bacterium]|nr:hypothetical protein [Gammaproteobacteria bacterium]
MYRQFILGAMLLSSLSAFSSDLTEKIVITGSRIDMYDAPAITLVKPADFLVQRIALLNDSRDAVQREQELEQTVRNIIAASSRQKAIELGVGKDVIFPIDVNNLTLDIFEGKRKDTSIVYLFIKTPIEKSQETPKIIRRLNDFIEDIKLNGRTEIDRDGEIVLSIVNPEKYRTELLQLIAESLQQTQTIFGNNYKAEVNGLSQALQWERAGVSELRLYIEYDFTIRSI